jgi:hypothetical protein
MAAAEKRNRVKSQFVQFALHPAEIPPQRVKKKPWLNADAGMPAIYGNAMLMACSLLCHFMNSRHFLIFIQQGNQNRGQTYGNQEGTGRSGHTRSHFVHGGQPAPFGQTDHARIQCKKL